MFQTPLITEQGHNTKTTNMLFKHYRNIFKPKTVYAPVKITNSQKYIGIYYILRCEIIPSQYIYSKLYRFTTKIIEK